MCTHRHFFTKRIATLWDSLPSDVMEAKNITGGISPIHGRKVHCELLNTKAQIRPLGQEVPVQQLPGAGRMRWRKHECVLAPFLHPVLGVHCPACPLLAPCSGCPLSRDGTVNWLAFWPLAVGLFFCKGPKAQVKTFSHLGI